MKTEEKIIKLFLEEKNPKTIREISKHHKDLHTTINKMEAEIEKLREEIEAKDNIIKGEREKIQILQKMIPEKEE